MPKRRNMGLSPRGFAVLLLIGMAIFGAFRDTTPRMCPPAPDLSEKPPGFPLVNSNHPGSRERVIELNEAR